MDPVGPPLSNDVHNQTHRQSILGSFLRVRPRGTSQSHQGTPLDHASNDVNQDAIAANTRGGGDLPAQPPSPNPIAGHRRRPAAAGGTAGIQPSISGAMAHGFNIVPPSTTSVSVHGLSQMLRRRRSANGALNSSSANPSATGAQNSPIDTPHAPTSASALPPGSGASVGVRPSAAVASANSNARTHRIRLVPHLDSSRSLHFEPICRDVREGDAALRIGRFTDRSGLGVAALNAQNTNKLAFKSKVVSRAHAEVWCDPGGKFFIKDTKSSSGTFLNHIRLSAPNTDSKPFPIKDGDVLQLGVDYQGGTEEIYKCVKMRVELGREWQAQPNAFNTNALKQLKALSAQPTQPGVPAANGTKPALSKSGISDCCICLFSVTVHQSLFIAPCSHVFHYKCIRPMLLMHHPGFSCPLCRTFANLEEDVEIDLEDGEFEAEVDTDAQTGGSGAGSGAEGAPAPPGTGGSAMTQARDANAMDVDAVMNVNAMLSAANEVAVAAAQANMNAAGAETEVERDFAPPNLRRRNYATPTSPININNTTINNGSGAGDVAVTLRNQHEYPRNRYFEGVPEDADEYVSAGSDDLHFPERDLEHIQEHIHELDENDELHPLPMLPVPSPSGALPLPVPSASASASASAHSQMQGFAIQRPMSVPISNSNNTFRRMALDEEGSEMDADGEGDLEDELSGMGIGRGVGMGIGVGVGGDGNASGSSGEGPLGGMCIGIVGAGEKRKR